MPGWNPLKLPAHDALPTRPGCTVGRFPGPALPDTGAAAGASSAFPVVGFHEFQRHKVCQIARWRVIAVPVKWSAGAPFTGAVWTAVLQ
jgi:hypothetical protein